MKKIILILFAICLTNSCVNDSEDYHEDQKKPYQIPSQYLFSQAEKSLVDKLVTPNFNRNVFRFLQQYWTETTYYTEVKYDFENRKVTQNFWNGLYLDVLGNLNDSKKIIEAEQPKITATANEIISFNKIKINKLAIIELLNVYTYQILVDTYGNIPYSEAGFPLENINPKYDDAETIYIDLITRTEKAIDNLDISEASFGKADFLYGGNITKWKKFGNSLLIKLGIALADQNLTLSTQAVNKGFLGGAILSNDDNAKFNYDSNSPNFNPLYDNLFASNRNDFVAADTFVNYLNKLNDPRREVYFQLYNEKDKNGNIISSYYKGGKFGSPGNTIRNSSKIGLFAYTSTTPGILFEASEINFYLAEAAARNSGYIVTGAENYYNNAITASFEFWNVPIGNYLSTVPYNSSNWKESIGMQAWIALYNRIDSWNTKRRLDYPILHVSSSSVLPEVPVRFRYPIDERTVNSANYSQAAAAIGKDDYNIKIFWDKY